MFRFLNFFNSFNTILEYFYVNDLPMCGVQTLSDGKTKISTTLYTSHIRGYAPENFKSCSYKISHKILLIKDIKSK